MKDRTEIEKANHEIFTATRFKLIGLMIILVWVSIFVGHSCESYHLNKRLDRIEQKFDSRPTTVKGDE